MCTWSSAKTTGKFRRLLKWIRFILTELNMFEHSLTATCVNLMIAVTVVPVSLQTHWGDFDFDYLIFFKIYLNMSCQIACFNLSEFISPPLEADNTKLVANNTWGALTLGPILPPVPTDVPRCPLPYTHTRKPCGGQAQISPTPMSSHRKSRVGMLVWVCR